MSPNPSDTGDRSPRQIKSVLKAAAILEELKDGAGLTLSDLSDRLNITDGSLHTYLSTLESVGFVTKRDGKYDLDVGFIPMSEYVRNQSELFRAGNAKIDELAFNCNEYVHLMTERKGLEIAIYESRGENAIGKVYYRQMREEPQNLHYSSAGKSMLAHMSDERVERIIKEHGLDRRTEATITTKGELFECLERVRERGYAVNDEEEMTGMRAVGAPIFDEAERITGAVSVSGPKSRLQDDFFREKLPAKVKKTANLIELDIRTSEYDQ